MLRDDPDFATSIGRHESDDRWTDLSKDARARQKNFFAERLKTLSGFPAADLSPENRLTARLVQYDFRSRLDAWELESHLVHVGQLFGFNNRVYLANASGDP